MKSRSEMKPLVTLLITLYAWALTASASTRQMPEPNKCSTAGLVELSAKQMRSRLKHIQAIDPPCCSRNLDLKGTIVLLVVTGETGDVTCVELVSGDPVVVTSTIQSVAKWRFQPQIENGQRRAFYGHLAIKFHATERAVTFKVTDEPTNAKSTPTPH
jgi:outer membrane biosynthesis protein TonB